jgi:hypothetical protein
MHRSISLHTEGIKYKNAQKSMSPWTHRYVKLWLTAPFLLDEGALNTMSYQPQTPFKKHVKRMSLHPQSSPPTTRTHEALRRSVTRHADAARCRCFMRGGREQHQPRLQPYCAFDAGVFAQPPLQFKHLSLHMFSLQISCPLPPHPTPPSPPLHTSPLFCEP